MIYEETAELFPGANFIWDEMDYGYFIVGFPLLSAKIIQGKLTELARIADNRIAKPPYAVRYEADTKM